MPAADPGATQLPQLDVAEDRQDVKAKLALVELPGPRSQAWPLGQPSGGEVGKADRPRIGVDPGAPVEIDSHAGKPGVGPLFVRNVVGPVYSIPSKRYRAWYRPELSLRMLPHDCRLAMPPG